MASGRQYQLHYDDHTAALTAVTTPSLALHQFSRISSLGVDRVIYLPPSSVRPAAGYTQYRDSTGRVIQVNTGTVTTRGPYNVSVSMVCVFAISCTSHGGETAWPISMKFGS